MEAAEAVDSGPLEEGDATEAFQQKWFPSLLKIILKIIKKILWEIFR